MRTVVAVWSAGYVVMLGASASSAGAQNLPGDARPQERQWPINPEAAPRPVAHAVRTADHIVVDGVPDEPAWRLAQPLGDFVQQVPRTGFPASQRTVVRVLYDSYTVYISAICYQNMREVITAGLEHDFESGSSDVFGVTLDTYLDRRNSFLFLVNPGGAVRDEQTFNDSRNVIAAWDGVVHVRTAITDSAWTVEMAIPLTTLRFDPTRVGGGWGVNFLRRIRRLNESSYWAPLDRRDVIHRMSKAGTLMGLDGLEQGRNLTLKPYVRGGNSRGLQVPASSVGDRYNAGGDLKYGVTPGVTLDLTYRTDFSQVEVDQEQVNLTRFSLFLPERREFFIENSGSFSFGDVSERNYRMGASLSDFTLFHSRRVGLTPDGRPIPIVGGGRVTGRVGRFDVGLLSMQTEETPDSPAENFGGVRLKRNVFGNSDVGMIFLNRQRTGGGNAYNRSYGADANIRLLGNMIINTYVAGSEAPGSRSDGSASRLSVAWRDRLWNTSAFAKRVTDDFDPGIGFIRRRAMQQYFGTLGVHARPSASRIQEVNPYVDVNYITSPESALETRELTGGLRTTFPDGGALDLEYRDQLERLVTAFRVSPGVVIPAGRYPFHTLSVGYQLGGNRPFSGGVRASGGTFYAGDRKSLRLNASWRARPELYMELTAERNDVALPFGSFVADVAGARVRYAFSTRFFGSAFVQYNTESSQLVSNVRLDFRHAPLSDVFVVFTERRDTRASTLAERSVALKVTRLFAF